MKKRIIKIFDKVILLLLGFSGAFYSCMKYGTIETEFEIDGTVTDKARNPIKHIQVIRQNYGDDDTLYTDSKGRFHLKSWGHNPHFKLEDIDGEENGGEFIPTEIDVQFTKDDLMQKGNMDGKPSKYAKKINIELEKEHVFIPEYGIRPAPYKE